jgi:hypothetical protein
VLAQVGGVGAGETVHLKMLGPAMTGVIKKTKVLMTLGYLLPLSLPDCHHDFVGPFSLDVFVLYEVRFEM